MPIFRRYAAFSSVIVPMTLALFCGKGSNNPSAVQEKGMLEIRARVVNKALAKSAATTADKLVVEVSANDMTAMRIERKLDLSRPSVIDTITEIPSGKNRRIVISAVNKDGDTTHIDSVESRKVTIEKAVVTPIFATLIPAMGSIYLQFAGLPTSVGTVYASFTASGGALIAENSVKRDSKMFMSLDNIPHMTAGTLWVAIVDTKGDTTQIAGKELTFNARADNSIDLQFVNNSGMVSVDVGIYAPGVTTGAYDFSGKSETTVDETGELIITEIMWNASDDNYIELYNPSSTSRFFETLTTDIDGTARHFTDVTIAGKGYFVIGRRNLPYFDAYTSATGGLPITTTGNWITVRRGANGPVIDRVICPGSNSALGWPTLSSANKRSIELAKDKYSVTANDFGKNWSAATELINEESTYYGTPGR